MSTAPFPRPARARRLWDARRTRAVEALLTAPSVAHASRTSGISERSIWRMLADPDFDAVLQGRSASALQQAEHLLSSGAGLAVAKLLGLMASRREEIALGAARAILTIAYRAQEQGLLVDEVEALKTTPNPAKARHESLIVFGGGRRRA